MLTLAAAAAIAVSAVVGGAEALKAEGDAGTNSRGLGTVALVMVEEPGCPHCARWHREIGPAYPTSAEGRFAPLERVAIGSVEARRLGGISFSPTFVVVRDRREIGRIVGYPGPDFFWPLLEEVLVKAGYRPARAATGAPKS